MAVKLRLRRPLLVGGVGLSFALLLVQSLHHSVAQLGEFSLMGGDRSHYLLVVVPARSS